MTLQLGTHFQVSYVTRSTAQATEQLVTVLGARQLDRFDDVRGADGQPTLILTLSHFALGDTEIELIEPRDPWPGSIYLDQPADDGRALWFHHLGFLLPTREAWLEAVREAKAQGIPVAMEMNLDAVAVAYFDTRSVNGHYIEAVYRAPGTLPGGVAGQPKDQGVSA